MAKTKISEFNANPALNTDIDSINIAEGCAPSGINDAIRELMSQLKDWQSGTSNDPMVIGSSGSLTLNQGTANGVAYLNGSKVVTSGSGLVFDGTKLGVGVASPVRRLDVSGQMRATSSTVFAEVDADSSTGVGYLGTASNHPIGFKLNDSEVGRWTSTGLGIGTSSPYAKLSVEGDINLHKNATNTIVSYTGSAYTALQYDAASHKFFVSGSTAATLDSSGNLGLGVTPSAWDADFKAIQIQRAAVSSYNNVIAIFSQNNYADKYIASSLAASKYQQNAGSHSWFTAPSGTAGNAITFTQALTLDANGNLLVGSGITGARLSIRDGGSNDSYFGLGANYDNYFSCGSSGIQVFRSGTSERARIDSSGNLLVGTTSATGTPTVGFCLLKDFSAGSASGLAIGHQSGTGGGAVYAQFAYNGSAIGSITQSGTTAVLYNTTSDQRLKENIQNADSASAIIDALQVRKFDWKSDNSHQRYGFVAQELATVAPEAVYQPEDASEMMAVDYSKLVPMLVKEVQSLRKRLADAGL